MVEEEGEEDEAEEVEEVAVGDRGMDLEDTGSILVDPECLMRGIIMDLEVVVVVLGNYRRTRMAGLHRREILMLLERMLRLPELGEGMEAERTLVRGRMGVVAERMEAVGMEGEDRHLHLHLGGMVGTEEEDMPLRLRLMVSGAESKHSEKL